MLPYIHIFTYELPVYTLCTLIGIFVAGVFVCKTATKRGHDDNNFIVLLLLSAIGLLLGSHIVYAFTQINFIRALIMHWSEYMTSWDNFVAIFSYIFGGSVFYGGLFGGMIAGLIYIKKKRFDLAEYSDILAPMVPLFHCFGRLGCFLGGCCYGIESPFGFTVHDNTLNPTINDVQRFPVQLLEASLNLVLFFALYYLLKKGFLKGGLFALYLAVYSVIRFFDEFLRGDTYRGFLFGLSTSQIISILVFVGTLIYFFVYFKKRNKLKPA